MNEYLSQLKRRIDDHYHLHGRRLFIADILGLVWFLVQCAYWATRTVARITAAITRWTVGVTARIASMIAHTTAFVSRAAWRSGTKTASRAATATARASVLAAQTTVNATTKAAQAAGNAAVVSAKVTGRGGKSFLYGLGVATIAVFRALDRAVMSVGDAAIISGILAGRGTRGSVRGIGKLVVGTGRAIYVTIEVIGSVTIAIITFSLRSIITPVLRGIGSLASALFHALVVLPLTALGFGSRFVARRVATGAHKTGDTTVDFVTSFHPLHPPRGWQRPLVAFIVMAAVLIAPFPALHTLRAMETVKEQSVNQAMNGIDAFSKAQDALFNKDVDGARTYFSQSYQSFLDAESALVTVPSFVFNAASYIPGMGKQAAEGKKLLDAGKELSLAGQELTEAFGPIVNAQSPSSRSLLSIADTVSGPLQQALPHLDTASNLIETIDPSVLPEHQRELLVKAQHQLPMVVSTAHDMSNALSLLHDSLGASQKKRYLVVLQNNTEIRPTGGFIGSFALVDVDRGQITSIEVPQGGSYDLQGSLTEHVISPDPLHLVNPQWQFQDANWFPDFPTSAKKLEWFYEKSGGSSVDGVIAINAQLGADILALTGPIDLPDYGKTINKDNFLLEIQKSVELEYDKGENKPKKLIADLVPEVISRLSASSDKDYGSMVALLTHALSSNDVQVYLSDDKQEAQLQEFGLGGYIKQSPRDYAMIVDSNIAGGKTDAVMSSKVNQTLVVNDDGTMDVTTRIWRQHNGVKGEVFTGVNNVDYMRLYVPQGSKLISAQGFNPPDRSLFKNPPIGATPDDDLTAIQGDVTYDNGGMYVNNEFGKTVFGNWVQTKPGQTSLIEVKYRLPFTVKQLATSKDQYGYMLLLQRQSASVVKDYSVDIVLPASYKVTWKYPDDMKQDGAVWHWQPQNFDQDSLLAFQFTTH